jgi:hypothetical protein
MSHPSSSHQTHPQSLVEHRVVHPGLQENHVQYLCRSVVTRIAYEPLVLGENASNNHWCACRARSAETQTTTERVVSAAVKLKGAFKELVRRLSQLTSPYQCFTTRAGSKLVGCTPCSAAFSVVVHWADYLLCNRSRITSPTRTAAG